MVRYAAREIRSGLQFRAFARQRSASASAVFASRIQRHLNRYGISLRDLVWHVFLDDYFNDSGGYDVSRQLYV